MQTFLIIGLYQIMWNKSASGNGKRKYLLNLSLIVLTGGIWSKGSSISLHFLSLWIKSLTPIRIDFCTYFINLNTEIRSSITATGYNLSSTNLNLIVQLSFYISSSTLRHVRDTWTIFTYSLSYENTVLSITKWKFQQNKVYHKIGSETDIIFSDLVLSFL